MKPTQPDILSIRRDPARVQLQLRIPRDLHYFQGHFDALPLLPGVVQVEWAIRFAQRYFEGIGTFHRLSALKFMRVITPETEPELDLRWDQAAGELSFRYGSETKLYSSGRVLFAPP